MDGLYCCSKFGVAELLLVAVISVGKHGLRFPYVGKNKAFGFRLH